MMKINKTVFVALLLSFVFCEQPKKQVFVLNTSDFRTEIKGKKTDIYLLKSDKIQVYITNYGGRIVSLLTPDNYGKMGDVVLGFKNIADYKKAKTHHNWKRKKEGYTVFRGVTITVFLLIFRFFVTSLFTHTRDTSPND